MTTKRSTLCLPDGFTDKDGVLHREVELRPLTGKTEEQLARDCETDGTLPVNNVLGHCLKRVGSVTPVLSEVVAGLSETDRSYLLMELYRETFGDRVQGRVSCPGPGCGETVDIDFSIQDLIAGGALEEETNAELELEAHCPECNAVFDFPFRPVRFFSDRIKTGLSLLYREVHVLAYNYHWSEAEILALPREKRHMYLGFLAESPVEGMPVHPVYTGSAEAEAEQTVSTPGDGWGNRTYKTNRTYRTDKTYRSDWTDKTYNAGSPAAVAGEDTPPGNITAGYTEVTEIELPPAAPAARGADKAEHGAFNPAAQGAYHPAARGASQPPADHAARGPYKAAGEPYNHAAGGATNKAVRQESHNPAQEIDGVDKDPGTASPPPKTAPRETPETTWTPFYTNSRSPVPSAFWARSYLGRFHLRTPR